MTAAISKNVQVPIIASLQYVREEKKVMPDVFCSIVKESLPVGLPAQPQVMHTDVVWAIQSDPCVIPMPMTMLNICRNSG